MKIVRHITAAIVILTLGSSGMLPRLPGQGNFTRDGAALAQTVQAGLQAYASASDAYAEQALLTPSVALWSLLIAAGVVLLEWLVAHRKRHGG